MPETFKQWVKRGLKQFKEDMNEPLTDLHKFGLCFLTAVMVGVFCVPFAVSFSVWGLLLLIPTFLLGLGSFFYATRIEDD
jgi:hypothetical protein